MKIISTQSCLHLICSIFRMTDLNPEPEALTKERWWLYSDKRVTNWSWLSPRINMRGNLICSDVIFSQTSLSSNILRPNVQKCRERRFISGVFGPKSVRKSYDGEQSCILGEVSFRIWYGSLYYEGRFVLILGQASKKSARPASLCIYTGWGQVCLEAEKKVGLTFQEDLLLSEARA